MYKRDGEEEGKEEVGEGKRGRKKGIKEKEEIELTDYGNATCKNKKLAIEGKGVQNEGLDYL